MLRVAAIQKQIFHFYKYKIIKYDFYTMSLTDHEKLPRHFLSYTNEI